MFLTCLCYSSLSLSFSDGEPSSKYCDKNSECWDWSERSLQQKQQPNTGDHRVTLFDLCSSDGGLDWRTIKVNTNLETSFYLLVHFQHLYVELLFSTV